MSDDERMREVASLPVVYTDPATGHTFSKSAPVVGITEEEIKRYSRSGNVCGECKFFEPGHFAAEAARTKFVRALVKDYEWNPRHAGLTQETTKEMGLCGATNDTATAAFNASCNHFVQDRGRIKRATKPEEHGVYVRDLRAAEADHAERFREFKRKHGLDDPRIIPDE